jgi:hypothetical protein
MPPLYRLAGRFYARVEWAGMGPISPITFSLVLTLVATNYVLWIDSAIRAVTSRRRVGWTIGDWLDVAFWLAISLAILRAAP